MGLVCDCCRTLLITQLKCPDAFLVEPYFSTGTPYRRILLVGEIS